MVSDLICPWCFVAKRRVEKAAAILGEMRFSHLRRAMSRGVSATTVGANAKQTRKAPQINRRFLVTILESRSAIPATTAIAETGIEASVPKPLTNGAYDASIESAGHQNL
jgi:hypothetical protein